MRNKLYDILLQKDCCGCSACVNVCPVDAINMNPDSEGFLYPQINEKVCIHCNKCEKICPILNCTNIRLNSHNLKVFAGCMKHNTEIKDSASGGAASAISETIINRGGVVFGVVWSKDFRTAYHTSARTHDEVKRFQGSKYIQSDKRLIYREVKETLKTGCDVLFIGLPCEVAALKNFLGKEYNNLFTCELVCYGPTSPKISEHFNKELETKCQSKIKNLKLKYKKNGKWTPPYICVDFENGKQFMKPFYQTDYGRAFSTFTRPSCYNCHYKGDKRLADITLGDYWNCTSKDKFYNPYGVSAIFVHTEKGINLINQTQNLELIETTYAHASTLNPMIYKKRIQTSRRDNFSEVLQTKGLHAACAQTRSIKQEVIKFSEIYLPSSIKPLAINIYKKIFG